MITGSHSGPEFDKLIPSSKKAAGSSLPKHVLSVRERVEEFAKARAQELISVRSSERSNCFAKRSSPLPADG